MHACIADPFAAWALATHSRLHPDAERALDEIHLQPGQHPAKLSYDAENNRYNPMQHCDDRYHVPHCCRSCGAKLVEAQKQQFGKRTQQQRQLRAREVQRQRVRVLQAVEKQAALQVY